MLQPDFFVDAVVESDRNDAVTDNRFEFGSTHSYGASNSDPSTD